MHTNDSLIGTVLAERYEILAKLGQGGMGAVYLAEEAANGSRVALKVLSPYYNNDLDFVARFRRGAEGMKSLQHPNIAAAYAVAPQCSQLPRFVRGQSIRQRPPDTGTQNSGFVGVPRVW